MPQMAPLNWLILFMYFILMFYLFNTLNYFAFLTSPKKENLFFSKKNISWKW
uniref:ATP synthase complex subunit 8 n=1 Tax=Coleoptera sp. ACP-2013 TaxID=2485033 RepID=A0A3G3MEG0_9COLE|nr:ATP synthase F0 subunit 8 [Coleoptera sp. ACP-2013]